MGLLSILRRILGLDKDPVTKFPPVVPKTEETPPKTPPMPESYLDKNPVTLAILQKITRLVPSSAAVYVPHINETLQRYGIDTPNRVAMFLAQIIHESDRLRTAVEYWGPTEQQQKYEGRKDLGNTQRGDGSLFRGRGLIQTTGRANYTRVSKALGIDFVSNPQLLETPEWAALSAGLFWKQNNLNLFADRGDIKGATRRINGGLTHLKERKEYYQAALNLLPV